MIKNLEGYLKIKSYCRVRSFFKKNHIKKLEKDFIFFSSKIIENYSSTLYKKGIAILKTKEKFFKNKSLLYLAELEKFDKEIFYNICKNFGNMHFLENIKNSKKIQESLKDYFKNSLTLLQTQKPIILFNKQNLKRLNYNWHQESQFYPNHSCGLHIWTPLFRDINDKNDGGLQFAITGNKTDFDYKEIKIKNSYTQRVPIINIEKNFQTLSVGAKVGDAIIFENKSVHRSDINNSRIPRVATVFRYLANPNNQLFKVL